MPVIDGRLFARKICGECGIEHYVPQEFEDEQVKAGPKGGWSCPNGHRRVYRESDADNYRREAERLKQRLAMKDDVIRAERDAAERERRRAAAYRGQATKLRKRAKAGICPCCTRHFTNLERHIASKHPDMDVNPEAPAENVVPFGSKTA